MAEKVFKQVSASGDTLRYIRPSELAASGITGEVLIGNYLGTVQNPQDPAKVDFKFQDSQGTVIVNSTGSLASKMKNVELGSEVKLIYNGKEEITTGRLKGKAVHSFDVFVASEA